LSGGSAGTLNPPATANAERTRSLGVHLHTDVGTVRPVAGGDLFVHISVVDENFDTLTKGQRVAFEEGANRRTGKIEAKNIAVIEASVERVRRYG
jgi:cold shock CspA family protein